MIYYFIFGFILFIFCLILYFIDKKDKSIRAAEKDEFYRLLRNLDENVTSCNYNISKIMEHLHD